MSGISLGKIGDIVRDEEAEGNTDLVYIKGKSAEVVFPRKFSQHDGQSLLVLLIGGQYTFLVQYYYAHVVVVFPVHAGGIPNDGIPNEVVVGIRIEVSVIFMLLAIVGIILSVIGMVLQIVYRKST